MSLLMDALKKAEQEKKEAAKKREESDEGGLHFQNEGTDQSEPIEVANEDISEPHIEPEPKPAEKKSANFSLEPIDREEEQAAEVIPEDQDSASIPSDEDDISEDELSYDHEESMVNSNEEEILDETSENERFQISRIDLDQTFQGFEKEEETAVTEYMEATVEGEPVKVDEIQPSFDETLPGVPAAQLAMDIGTSDQPTPVAAQTIFAATNTDSKPSSIFKWSLICLAILAIGSAVVFYYYSVTPMPRDFPSPNVARGVESIIDSPIVGNIVPPTSISQTQTLMAETTPASSGLDSETGGSGFDEGTETTVTEDSVVQETGQQVEEGPVEDADMQAQPVETAEYTAFELADTDTLPTVIEPPMSLIRITRSQRSNAESQLIRDAFTAFKTGDYALAETKYREAQLLFPENRDVLLGLAAIAGKKGDSAEALNIYIQLLRQNPLDNVARAAVLGYQDGNNVTESISMIKSMLFDAPEQPLLYFTLGKLQASNANWSEAQLAFFDAYRLDSSNPDYALNLAVSLDRLGQRQTALDYYSAALELARINPAGFDTGDIQERIITLNTGN